MPPPTQLHVLGAGPAGSISALSALQQGTAVQLVEKSPFPRHKVCGEFLSPEIASVLDSVGVLDHFLSAAPARIRRMILHLGATTKAARLPEPAYGLTRYRYDHLLYSAAVRQGAASSRDSTSSARPLIVATGRRASATPGKRIFGFKAHFRGPVDDAVELFFFGGCYVGLNTVEGGVTNVCGLGPERELKRFAFDVDALLASSPALRDRLAPLERDMKWMNVGPLVYGNRLASEAEEGVYLCGDALSFIDPFTGSGLLSAAITGELAGRYAAQGLPVSCYLEACRKALETPFTISSVFRGIAGRSWAGLLASLVPGQLLYRWTRPHI